VEWTAVAAGARGPLSRRTSAAIRFQIPQATCLDFPTRCRGPFVAGIWGSRRFDQEEVRLLVGEGLVLDAAWDDKQLAGADGDLAVAHPHD
jgi:hypothetical protein